MSLSLSLSFIVPMTAMQYTNIVPADAGEYIRQGNRRNFKEEILYC